MTVWTWLKANWRPTATVVLSCVLFALHRWVPMANDVRELLIVVGAALGLYGTAVVPSFARIDPPKEP